MKLKYLESLEVKMEEEIRAYLVEDITMELLSRSR